MSVGPTTQESKVRQPQPVAGRKALGFDLGWQHFIDTTEYVPELRWPMSVRAYQKMRTDAQLSGLFRAMTMPIRRFRWLIDPNNANPAIVDALSADLNLDVKGQEPRPRGRRKRRFSFDRHLYHALLALMYGHMYFEQVGEIVDNRWRLRKLVPIMPDTITQILTADDGGLISVKQGFSKPVGTVLGSVGIGGQIELPVDRIAAYVWEQEGANWVGRSIFRDCYRNWLIKDRLMRVDAINHERAGGVPWIEAQPGASPKELEAMKQMAMKFKVGEDSGGAVPSGATLNIARLGAGTDVVASIRMHDEAMARLFLHMFIQLGQTTTGSRALGEAFIEQAIIAQKAVAQWFIDITNEHVIEDWVDWNFGEDEEFVPLLTYEMEPQVETLTVEEMVKLVDAGIIQVDEDLEAGVRERYNLMRRSGQLTQAEA